MKVRVKPTKFIRYRGSLYTAGDTFELRDKHWDPDGVGQMVELVKSDKSKSTSTVEVKTTPPETTTNVSVGRKANKKIAKRRAVRE